MNKVQRIKLLTAGLLTAVIALCGLTCGGQRSKGRELERLLGDRAGAFYEAMDQADQGNADAMFALAAIMLDNPDVWKPKHEVWLTLAEQDAQKAVNAGNKSAQRLLDDVAMMKTYLNGGRADLSASDLLAEAQDRATSSHSGLALMVGEQMARQAQSMGADAEQTLAEITKELSGKR